MEKRTLALNFILLALIGFAVTSCSSDNDAVSQSDNVTLAITPVKKPDVSIYSGGKTLYSTFAQKILTRAVVTELGTPSYKEYSWEKDLPEEYWKARPEDVSEDEKTFVKKYINDNPDANVDFYNINYYVQYVGGSSKICGGATMIDNKGTQQNVWNSTNQMSFYTINGIHLNSYQGSFGQSALCLNLPVKNATYTDTWGNVDVIKTNAYRIYKITYNKKEGYYLGFDYKTKNSNGAYYDGDGIYDDYVIKLTPYDDTTYGNPGATTVSTDEVEVNLSVNAAKATADYISTKLSIHLRAVTDAEVVIPVPAEYYSSDVNGISTDKNHGAEVSSESATNVSYTVNGQTVSVAISYAEDGIHVKTSGFNKAALDYLSEKYDDGITFEVWNYYKNSIPTGAVTRDFLKSSYFDKSTVTFANGVPASYINAFAAVNNYNGIVYGVRDAEGVWTPYSDEACTQVLDGQYWTREGAADAREYILTSHVNEWDCAVTPTNEGYSLSKAEVKLSEQYYKVYKK